MILAAKVALGCAGTLVAGTAMLCSEGFLHVDVEQRGPDAHHIAVMAPAMLVPIAVDIATHFADKRKVAGAADQLEPWMPTIQATLGGLSRVEDMTLVDVNERDEHVRVSKFGSSIVVDVNDKDAVVHVSAPIRAISSTVREVADSDASSNN
jgi:hypothetical protein